MGKEYGLAAFALDMPEHVPHTEYSAHYHWDLINKVTGSHIGPSSTGEEKQKATSAFVKAWDYSFMYNTPLDEFIFGNKRTKMGHCVFAAGGTDFDEEKFELFQDTQEIYDFDFFEAYGERYPGEICRYFNENYQMQMERYPDCVNTSGIYVTGMSGLIEVCGWDMLLLAAGEDYHAFGRVLERYAKWIQSYFEGLAMSEIPIVSVHDDIVWASGPFLPANWYREFLFPQYKKYFAPLLEAGKKILYICDGNYTQFIDDIAACGVHGFVMEPTTDLSYVAEHYGKSHVMVGNADTRILLNGSREQIYGEVKRCMDIGKKCPGFIMAVGNHIPANTPVENAEIYFDAWQKLGVR